MTRVCVFIRCAAAVLLVCLPSLRAQSPAQTPVVASRIVAAVDESKLVTFKGSVPARARAEFDRGRAQASAQLTSVRLVLSRSPEQAAALKKFMAEQLTPGSPNYHRWLTPEQFGKLYGPSDADIETLVTWLRTQGLTVRPVSPGRISIAFSGSVSQIEAAFHTEIHSFNANGEEFLSNISNPSIPAALAPVVSGIAHLGTLRPRPLNIPGRLGNFDMQSKRLVAARQAVSPNAVSPNMVSSSGGVLYVTPSDAATIYNTPNSLNANFSGSSTYNGAGVTIGIGGDSPIQASTVTSYRQTFLGDSTAPTITNVSTAPATDTSDQGEAYLDTELAGGLAPGATIHYYASDDLFTAVEQAADDNTVDIFSLSFGACEMNFGQSGNDYMNQLWQLFYTEGITVTVSTGDSGSAGCDNPNKETAAKYGLQVNALASTPYNLAIGGTDYYGLISGFNTYVDSANGTLYRTAKGYIPESTWNDSVQSNGLLAQNAAYADAKTGANNIVGGSGGASSCATSTSKVTNGTTSTTCTAGYAKPDWQTGTGVPSDGVRDLPDVSLLAGDGMDNAAWLVCTDDTGTVGGITVTANCSTQSNGSFYFFGYGGTSTSAPAFAGILAMVVQKTGSRIGMDAAKTLYQLADGSYQSAVFHDVTQGNISVPCTAGTTNCSKNSAGNYFLTGFDTTAGYDLATGLGSVDVTQLVTYWSKAAEGLVPSFSVSAATPAAVTAGSTSSATVTVTARNGYAGSVALACALTSSPSGAQKAPTCSISGSSVTLSASATSGTATVNFFTTAATAKEGALAKSNDSKLLPSGAATLVALLAFFGIPARRRAWRAVLGVLVLVVALASLSACGGSSSTGSGTNGSSTSQTAGTTSGDYVFTITGTGTPSVSPTPTTTVTLHVN